jgi:hypothetical protein
MLLANRVIAPVAKKDGNLPSLEGILCAEHDGNAEPAETVVCEQPDRKTSSGEQVSRQSI